VQVEPPPNEPPLHKASAEGGKVVPGAPRRAHAARAREERPNARPWRPATRRTRSPRPAALDARGAPGATWRSGPLGARRRLPAEV